MKKLFGIGAVMMFAAVATSNAVGGGWSCNTTCRDSHGFEYVQVSSGSGPDQAYQNLSCQEGDTVSGDINCWQELAN